MNFQEKAELGDMASTQYKGTAHKKLTAAMVGMA
jgi:hypothetical protein